MSTQAAQPLSITDQIRRSVQTAVRVYNASDEPFSPVYSSIAYPCDPDPKAGKGIQPGEWITIPDRADYQRNERGRILWDEPMEVPKGGTGAEIAGQILEYYQANGITVLLGDGHDEERKRIARRAWLVRKVETATNLVASWEAKVAKIMSVPGSIPPRQDEKIKEALTFLAAYDGGFIDRKRYVTFDGADHETWDRAVNHLEQLQSKRLAAEGGLEAWLERSKAPGVQAPIIDVEELKKKQAKAAAEREERGEPRVQEPREVPEKPEPPSALPDNDAAFLLGKAQELGVRLTAKELTALIRQDRDEIEAITDKLAVAAAKAKAGKKNE